MQIVSLRTQPQHLPELARIYFETWGYINPGETLTDVHADLLAAYGEGSKALPETFIAIENDTLLGAATLKATTSLFADVKSGPWLAGVYVQPAQRSRGIAGQLIRAVENEAITRGHPSIYLCTHEHEAYYAKTGYRTIDTRMFQQQNTHVMVKTLTA